MKLTHRFFNKGIFFNEIKRLYWVPLLYTLLLFLMIPMQMMMEHQGEVREVVSSYHFRYMIENVLNFRHISQGFTMILIPVVIGLLVTRYLQNKNHSDFTHSLPIPREALLITHGAVGILILLLPLLLTTFSILLLRGFIDLQHVYVAADVWVWFGTQALMGLALYSVTLFVGMATGMTIPQGIITYILLVLPMALHLLIVENLQIFLYGFSPENALLVDRSRYEEISPLMRIFELGNRGLSSTEVIGYSFFIIILIALSIYLYRIRRLENTLEVIVFKPLKIFFQYGVTFCTTLLAGMYFYHYSGRQMLWAVFGYAFFALIGYSIAEGIILKSVRIFSKKLVVGYGIILMVMALTGGVLAMDLAGFEGRIPEVEEIEKIYLGHHQHEYQWRVQQGTSPYYETEENITHVQAIHQRILDLDFDRRERDHFGNQRARNFYIRYHLKDGQSITRVYSGIPEDVYGDIWEAMMETREHRTIHYPVLNLTGEEINQIFLSSDYSEVSEHLRIIEPEEVESFLLALQKDIEESSFETLERGNSWGYIGLMLKAEEEHRSVETEKFYREISQNWLKAFTNVEEWLEERDHLKDLILTTEDVSHVVVERLHDREPKIRMEIGDPEKIKEVIDQSTNLWRGPEVTYLVGFYNENNEQMIMKGFEAESVPEFVEAFFQE